MSNSLELSMVRLKEIFKRQKTKESQVKETKETQMEEHGRLQKTQYLKKRRKPMLKTDSESNEHEN